MRPVLPRPTRFVLNMNRLLLAAGIAFQLFALVNATVTLANNDYRPAIRDELIFTLLADATLLAVASRGTLLQRIVSLLAFLPTTYVLWDFGRRGLRLY